METTLSTSAFTGSHSDRSARASRTKVTITMARITHGAFE